LFDSPFFISDANAVSAFSMRQWTLLVLALMCATTHSRAADPPNIVFILADDLGAHDLGCYGSRYHQTPNLDALAKRGLLFRQAYAANPLCSPTRASIMTGQYPARLGITAPVCHQPEVRLTPSVAERARPDQKCLAAQSVTRLDTNYVTLAETLRARGYATGHFGKWHLGREPYSPLQQGFEVDVPHWSGPGPAGSYVAPWKFSGVANFQGQPGEHLEDRMAAEAAKFIKEHRDRPFFLNYWSFSVHAVLDGKESLVRKYRESADPNSPQRHPVFAAMVHSLDDAVGTLVNALDENGLTDKTLIVFFSDNGGVNWSGLNIADGVPREIANALADVPTTSNAPLRAGKASIYEGGTREPCIIAWPGVVRPGTTDAMIQSIDFYPTLCAIAGAPLPKDQPMDGRSFLPALEGKADKHRDEIFCFFPHNTPASGQTPAVSVRKGDWKLIRFFHDGPDQQDRHELYNLRDDLSETTDRAAEKPEIVAELSGKIDQFLKDTGALVPGPNPRWRADAAD
jgi:arylsulfatase A-like enzyme